MPWGTITATILALAAAGVGFGYAGTDAPAPNTAACFEAPAEGLMQPFSRPGWSRAGSGMGGGGRVIDEPRWWPTPLIAPWEAYRPGSLGFDPHARVSNCFPPGSNPTDAELQALERSMRPLVLRYFTNSKWPTRTVTWSFVPDGTMIPARSEGPDSPSTLFATLDSEFDTRARWIGLFESVFARWSQLSGIEFVRVRFNGQEWDDGGGWNTAPAAPGLRGDIRISARPLPGSTDVLADCRYPPDDSMTVSPGNGNMRLDSVEDWGNSDDNYRYFRNIIGHELGHGLGLAHTCPKDKTKLMEPVLFLDRDGPQHDDARGAQALYGDVYEPNNSASAATSRGSLTIGGFDFLGAVPTPGLANSAVCSIVPDANQVMDQDWYRYSLSVPTTVSVTIYPVGFAYPQEPEGRCAVSNPTTTLSRSAQKLTVSLIAGNGVTVVGSAVGVNIGSTFVLSDVSMPIGPFYVRVTAESLPQFTTTQMYQMSVAAGVPPTPVNNTCASALGIGLGTISSDNGGATTDGGATACGTGFNDVWYAYTPACEATLQITTCGSALDTILSVYTACGGSVVACNDAAVGVAGCDSDDSALTVPVNTSTTYLIRVAGKTATPRAFTLNLSLVPPANDACASAVTLSPSFSINGSTCSATPDGTSACVPLTDTPDVWYRYIPDCTGTLSVDTCGSTYNTVLSLHTGACGSLTQIACNDDTFLCPPVPTISQIQAPVVAGQTYLLRVSGFNGDSGRFRMQGRIIQSNDTCAGATTITPGIYSVSLCNAGREGPPGCALTSTAPDVFFRYVPSTSGVMTLDTCGSPAGTVLELLTGTCGAPVAVACNNDQGATTCPAGPTTARIDFTVTAGTPYIIRLVGSGSPSTSYTLRLNQAPPNDLCASAITIPSGVHTGTTVGGSREANPACAPTGTAPDVWYRWVAPCEGEAVFDTCGSSFDTALSVYTGAGCSALTEVGCNDNSFLTFCGGGGSGSMIQSYLRLAANAGTTYWIRVAGAGAAAGAFNLRVGTTVANDTCATAAAATVGSVFFDTRCATPNGSATCIASSASPDVWYRYIGSCNGAVWMNTCSSNYDTVLSVSTGTCTALTQIACNDDQGANLCSNNFRSSRVVFRGTTGTTYLVRVGGVITAAGTGNLSISCCPADYNLSGTVSVQDIFDFLAGYFANAPAADVNNSGTISVQDIFDFLAAYFAGCP